MTEKRFTKVSSNGYWKIKDNQADPEKMIFNLTNPELIEDRLNELNDENQHIKQTIKDMMENERTELGKSVLKQLYEAIQ